MEVEYCLPEVQVGACSHSPGVCSTFCRGVQMCHPLMELGSLHEMAGSLSPVLRENIKSRIIRLRTQIHRQIFLHIYWYSQWTGKKKRLEIKNDAVLYSSRTRGSEFHSFCWEFIFSLTTASLYLLGITFISDSKDTSEEISFPGTF